MLSCWLMAPHCPERSTCAKAPGGASNHKTAAIDMPVLLMSPPCGTGSGIPFRVIEFLLEMDGHNPCLLQVRAIFNDQEKQDSLLARRLLDEIPILCQYGVRAVRHAVFPQIAGTETCRHDVQRATARAPARLCLPARKRFPLPRRCTAGRFPGAEMQ